jgi:hypothetical protein
MSSKCRPRNNAGHRRITVHPTRSPQAAFATEPQVQPAQITGRDWPYKSATRTEVARLPPGQALYGLRVIRSELRRGRRGRCTIKRRHVQVERPWCSRDLVLRDGIATAHDLELRPNGRRKFCSLLADSHCVGAPLARLCGFWLTQLGLLGKSGSSPFRALPEGVRRAGRRYRVGASVTSLATYRTNAMRPVSSSQ